MIRKGAAILIKSRIFFYMDRISNKNNLRINLVVNQNIPEHKKEPLNK